MCQIGKHGLLWVNNKIIINIKNYSEIMKQKELVSLISKTCFQLPKTKTMTIKGKLTLLIANIHTLVIKTDFFMQSFRIPLTVNVLKFLTFLYLFSIKIWVIKTGIPKTLDNIANREDPDQTASGLCCLSRPFLKATSVKN